MSSFNFKFCRENGLCGEKTLSGKGTTHICAHGIRWSPYTVEIRVSLCLMDLPAVQICLLSVRQEHYPLSNHVAWFMHIPSNLACQEFLFWKKLWKYRLFRKWKNKLKTYSEFLKIHRIDNTSIIAGLCFIKPFFSCSSALPDLEFRAV